MLSRRQNIGGDMPKSRREFLTNASLAVVGTAVMGQAQGEQKPGELPPGAPPALGTTPAVGPAVSSTTFVEAEKLVQVELKDADIKMAAASWRSNLAPVYERRTGPRRIQLETGIAPWSRWDPVLPGQSRGPEREVFIRAKSDPGP